MDADAAVGETRIAEQVAVQVGIGFDAGNGQLGHRNAHFCHCLFAGFAVYADFADQAVVVRRNAVALINVAVHAYAKAAGQVAAFNQAGAGDEVVRVFGVDAAFEGMAFQNNVFLLVLQFLACRHAQLFLNDVHAGNQFGNGVLDLYAGVHFDKEKFAVFIQEFERSRTAVADAFAGFDAGFADFLALSGGDAGRRGFFDDFLVAALHGAVALAQVDGVAVFVGQHLDFDVARALQVAFHVNHGVAECGAGFGFGHFHRFDQVFFFFHHAHAASAAAARCFDDDGVADFGCGFDDGFGVVGQCAVRTGHAGHPRFLHGLFGRHFVAHQADGVGARADEDEAGLFDLFGKVGVFGQKAVAGVDSVRTGYFCGGDDGRDVQVTLGRGGGADADGFVGQFDVQAVFVGFGMDGNGGNAHFAAGAQDAECDFPTVGD